jgi:hypothetical protein
MGTRFTVKLLRQQVVQGSRESHKARHEKEVWAKPGRVIKAASRWHLQGTKLLPKSPLDSSSLEREKQGEGAAVLRKVVRRKRYSLKTKAERKKKERERETERAMHLLMQKKTATPILTINKTALRTINKRKDHPTPPYVSA